ncbi:hypothetical protein [Pseudomonas matsuisoli]|uniref:Haloacid dehalogenase n=1 Tax=Pseudomonas matsuisoli TaxID=1515666 RepID=A0A917PV75_9PSED|nr:hypothetical protein [Pseudomonas matsuisoli]GGJ93288.1 hypothetical protein GCM10009304_19020 [Pseudomonas matsuisoli]
MRITQYKALGFSCYGTLMDREGGVLEGLRPLLAHTQPKWLMAAYVRTLGELRTQAPSSGQKALHAQTYLRLAQDLQQPEDWDAGLAFGNNAGRWPIFEDAPGALMYLSKFYRLVLLPPADMDDATVLTERLPVTFDAIVDHRAEDPHSALDKALKTLDLDRSDLLPVRSPATDDPWQGVVDFPVCTLRRRHGLPWQKAAQAIDVKRCEYASLADLVHAHQIALRA